VLSQALQAFQGKFEHFRQHIGLMDSLFEATFSPLAATGKNMSKCGRCSRYMRYIPMRPQVNAHIATAR
jgi:DNA topoisomerase-3